MNIGIVGLGLIGGCLGLDLRAQGLSVFGVGRREDTCLRAMELGVVDTASVDLALMSQADLIFVCTPLGAIRSTVAQMIPHLKPDAIVTDVGSVKASVVESVSPLWPHFVAGHPMAGKAESGIEVAERGLFVDKPYVITPTEHTSAAAVEQVANVARLLQARIYQCGPEEHDRAVAWISHLPVMISSSLIGSCLSEPDHHVLQLAQNLASTGFKDTSRVGGGNPELGLMMATYNRDELLRSLLVYRGQLDRVIGYIEDKNWQDLELFLQQNSAERPKFL